MSKKMKSVAMLMSAVLVAAYIPAMPAEASEINIPSSAKEYKGHMYAVCKAGGDVSWERAQQLCEAKGGHLVTITSAQEDVFVEGLVRKSSGSDMWIGAYYDDNWKWVTGEKFSYKNSGFGSDWGDYLIYHHEDDWTGWSHPDNDERSYYICEWDTSTEDVLPAQVTLSNVKKASSKSCIVTWKKVSDTAGYSVYMKTGSKGSYKKVATIKGKSITSYYADKLKKGQTYYFRVRAYKKIYGEKSYGELSAVKKVKL